MPREPSSEVPVDGPRDGSGTQAGRAFFNLLRYSHIFASAIQEVLETGPIQEATPHPLTGAHLQLLRLMSANGAHRLGAVAGFLGVSPPAATKTIDKLEHLDLVFRVPVVGDRRAKLLAVTPRGRRLLQRYEERRGARLAPVLEAFRPDEVEEFAGFLRRFALMLLKQEEQSGKTCLRCAAHVEENCPISRLQDGCPYQKSREWYRGEGGRRGAARSRGRATARGSSPTGGDPAQGSLPS